MSEVIGSRVVFISEDWEILPTLDKPEGRPHPRLGETARIINITPGEVSLIHEDGRLSSGTLPFLRQVAYVEPNWDLWLPPRPTPTLGDRLGPPDSVKDGQVYASCWTTGGSSTSSRVWRVASAPGQPDRVEVLAGVSKGAQLPFGVFYDRAVLVVDVGQRPTPPDAASSNAGVPVEWDKFLPEYLTSFAAPRADKRHVGQVYVSRWSMSDDCARVWQITEEGDLVLAGMSKGRLFGKAGGDSSSHKGAISYKNAVLIFNSMVPEQAQESKVLSARTIGRHLSALVGDSLREKLEKEIADKEGVPTCTVCGGRRPVGKSGKCTLCWKSSLGAKTEVVSSFVPDIDDLDLLPGVDEPRWRRFVRPRRPQFISFAVSKHDEVATEAENLNLEYQGDEP